MSFASILFINLLFKIMSSIMTKKQSSKSLQKEGSSNLKTTSITSANIIKSNRSKSPSIKKFVKEILAGNVSYLSRAITLIESTNKKHQKKANIILEQCLPFANKSVRIGITGVPGVGKSTFIEVLGKHLTSNHKKVAVLAVDPSSSLNKGSILGDKTRMEELSNLPNVFIRPSPSKGELGGVTEQSYESILLCEKAGFDVIIVETVGVGQNEVDIAEVATKVVAGIYDGITTVELDNLAAETAASLNHAHPDYSYLAARIAITRLHKTVSKKFSEVIESLYSYTDPKTGLPAGLINDDVIKAVRKHADTLNESILHDRDFNFDYFGFKTLEKSYLLKMNGQTAEAPQHMYMRVAVGIWGDDIQNVLKTYELLSTHKMTHATPTLFNAGTKRPQLSSCFL